MSWRLPEHVYNVYSSELYGYLVHAVLIVHALLVFAKPPTPRELSDDGE
jgi:hypothetical protein